MARKKKDNDSPKRGRPPAPAGRAADEVLRQLLGGAAGPGDDSPAGQARDLIEQAEQEPDLLRRQDLVRQALALWPDCADAYLLLAEDTSNRRESLALYEQALAAGERALGPRPFREDVGHFWGLLETRPYMRARIGLAYALWVDGRREEAVRHAEDMLRLNPNDNQGIRYTLAGWLLALDRDDELAHLIERYGGEHSAVWAWTSVLLAFRRQGEAAATRDLLRQAKKVNKYVPDFLLGKKPLPEEMPDYYSPGKESEAVLYAGDFLAAWRATPGALDWLRRSGRKRRAVQAEGPSPAVKEALHRVPQAKEDWQADVRRLSTWVKEAGVPVRPWLVLVLDASHDLVLMAEVVAQPPTPDLLWDRLARTMRGPAAGPARRPVRVQVRPGSEWAALRPHLDEVGVTLVEAGPLDVLDAAYEHMREHLSRDGEPERGLLDVPGVTAERAASFYQAAAGFYRAAPWRRVGYESAVQIDCAGLNGGPWYAVLMGQMGVSTGLALYEDYELLRAAWGGELSDEEHARLTVATSVTFGEEFDLPLPDLEAAERYGWEVAGPDAWPCVRHKDRGFSMRPPLAWELELLEACLRALPAFVARRRQNDPSAETTSVLVGSGERTLTLAWVPAG